MNFWKFFPLEHNRDLPAPIRSRGRSFAEVKSFCMVEHEHGQAKVRSNIQACRKRLEEVSFPEEKYVSGMSYVNSLNCQLSEEETFICLDDFSVSA